MSSAYTPILKLPFGLGISEVNKLYKKGERTVPWGTPALIGLKDEYASLNLTRKNLLSIYEIRSLARFP